MSNQNGDFLQQHAAAAARLGQRPVHLYWIPTEERAEARQAADDLFEDVAAVGLVVLTYAEQKAVGRRYKDDMQAAAVGLLASAMRAVVVGGQFTEPPEANTARPTALNDDTDAMRVITRMHPIALERAMLAFTDLHNAKEGNTKGFLKSRTIIAV